MTADSVVQIPDKIVGKIWKWGKSKNQKIGLSKDIVLFYLNLTFFIFGIFVGWLYFSLQHYYSQ